jgi:hypothetical protein
MTLSQVYDYFRAYDKGTFNVFACSGNEPNESDVAAFESIIGHMLPSDFREFTMSPLGGLYMEVKEELWPPAKQFDVGPFWSFLRGIKVFGIADGMPEWLDIREQYRQLAEFGFPTLVPFLQIAGDANLYCFTPTNEIVLWDHEVPDEPEHVKETFASLLIREIRELENRKEQKLRGEDKTIEYNAPRPSQPKETRPCPECGEPLRSPQARQCFSCGADWH